MKKGRFVAYTFALALVLALVEPETAVAATPPTCAPPATQFDVAGTLSPTTPFPILSNPNSPLQAALIGIGTFQGHVVWQPLTASLSDGCQENSRFTVEGFVGSVVIMGPLAVTKFGASPFVLLSATQPTNASLQVHFGDQPSKPVLTFQSDQPVTFFGLPAGPVQVQLVQIVGLDIVVIH